MIARIFCALFGHLWTAYYDYNRRTWVSYHCRRCKVPYSYQDTRAQKLQRPAVQPPIFSRSKPRYK